MYIVDQVKLAEVLGVSKVAVHKAIKSKRLIKSVTKSSSNRYEIELKTAILEWFANANISKDSKNQHQHPLTSAKNVMELEESRRIREHYLALNEEITYRREKGEYIATKVANKEVYDLARDTRERLFNIPEGLSHTLAVEKDPSKVRRILQEEIEKALTELSKNVFS